MYMYQIKLEQFEGPLDLLLQFIEEEKLKINDISLAIVTNHYLEYLNNTNDLGIEELADFLVVAAKLILIKSRSLLPTLDLLDEEVDLGKQLKIYKEYYEASKKIEMIGKQPRQSFSRLKPFRLQEVKFIPPLNINLLLLSEAMANVLKNLEFVELMPKAAIERTINISEKINEIKKFIIQKVTFGFQNLMGQAKDRLDLVVSFLAVLELVKQRFITVKQDQLFEEIVIEKIKIQK